MLERKYISKENWKRVISSKYLSCDIVENQSNIGEAGLLIIEKVREPLVKEYKGIGKVKLLDENYYWLQIALKGVNYWITAMYNENKELIQYYIDITNENVINNEEDSYFYDLFLDVVIFSDGKTVLLDENELMDALNYKIITDKQYKLAYSVADNVLENIRYRKKKLDEFCFKYLKKLERKVDNENE